MLHTPRKTTSDHDEIQDLRDITQTTIDTISLKALIAANRDFTTISAASARITELNNFSEKLLSSMGTFFDDLTAFAGQATGADEDALITPAEPVSNARTPAKNKGAAFIESPATSVYTAKNEIDGLDACGFIHEDGSFVILAGSRFKERPPARSLSQNMIEMHAELRKACRKEGNSFVLL